MCAGTVLALHSHTVTKSRGSIGCPVVVAEGKSQTGKSTCLSVALALLGMFACIDITCSSTVMLFNR